MSDENAIHVNFSRPMPLFPLEGVVLLPQQVIPLHVFEPRYRQMVARTLDTTGQIALATFEGSRWKQEYHGRPPLRPAVCVGNIVQHEALEDGRYNILVQGVCRARIVKELPASPDRLYREAMLEPVGLDTGDPAYLSPVRERLAHLLAETPLKRASAAGPLVNYLEDANVPTHAILELVSFTLCARPALSYTLLAEGDVQERARIVLRELESLADLVGRAERQTFTDLPKGCHWN